MSSFSCREQLIHPGAGAHMRDLSSVSHVASTRTRERLGMTPGSLRVLTCVLTLPLVVFVADAVAALDPVDPDRSRPVIIGDVSDDQPADQRTQDRPRRERLPVVPAPEPDEDPRDRGSRVADPIGDQRYSVVVPPPRDLSDDDSGFDDDDRGDDDDDDDADRGDSDDD